jgi:hypothetical protein
MTFFELLSAKRETILERWFDKFLQSYPEESSNLLRKNKNLFSNPMQTFNRDMGLLFDELILHELDPEKLTLLLDNMVRIRAVQDFSSSQAVSFIFSLKEVIQDELFDDIHENGMIRELFEFESRIDKLALLGFDVFMKCRERIYELKSNELKARAHTLLKRANMLCEIPES